jgi:hypothetical protein
MMFRPIHILLRPLRVEVSEMDERSRVDCIASKITMSVGGVGIEYHISPFGAVWVEFVIIDGKKTIVEGGELEP